MTDYEWGAHKPGEVGRESGRARPTSPFDHPAAPGGVRLDTGCLRGDVLAAASMKAGVAVTAATRAGVPAGRAVVPASVLPVTRFANEAIRGGWL